MNKLSTIRSHAVRAVLFLLATSLAGFASVIGSFDRSFQVSGPVDLEVLTRSGDVTVRSGPSGTVTVHGKIHSGNYGWFDWGQRSSNADIQELEKNPPIRQSGNSIRIDYVNYRNISIDYEVIVPENTSVRGHTGSGNQRVEGVKGTVDLEAGSGDMELDRLSGDLRFQTGSGNIRGREVSGPVRLKAGSGDIEIEEVGQGDVDARTGSGNITVRGVNGGFRAETGSGDIRADGKPVSLWSIRTGSGNVDLRVPSGASFDVDISSNSGTVTVGHPVTTTVQGRVQERKSVVGRVRDGGPTVSVHTGSGDIHLD
jgi:hypothetical protein